MNIVELQEREIILDETDLINISAKESGSFLEKDTKSECVVVGKEHRIRVSVVCFEDGESHRT